MYCLVSQITNPCFNLACEDYLLHFKSEDFIILSINDPSVIVGKHQVVHREVNIKYTTAAGIPVLRRISGGGTVYHDHGNLNFAFVRQSEKGKQIDFGYYVAPVIEFLGSLGLDAKFEGKNDIRVNGLKISGNAEHVYRERVLHHGTLLFDASFDEMRKALRPADDLYVTRAVESNRTTVANIKPLISNVPDTVSLMNLMAKWFSEKQSGLKLYFPDNNDIKAINELAETRYGQWEWNFGYAPPYSLKAWLDIDGAQHGCRIHVKDGIIWECDIDGPRELNTAGKQLIGCRHMFSDVAEVLRNAGITADEAEVSKLF